MGLFQFNPTIRETNKYLDKTVGELITKHGNVSNPDFEKDLIATTGIGWKQVKNYKNHPKPYQRLKDNSVVIKYVRGCRQKDTWRKVRLATFAASSLISVIGISYWYITKPKEVEKFVVHEFPPTPPQDIENIETRVFLKVESKGWLFRLGPVAHSSIDFEKFSCFNQPVTGLKNCSYNETSEAGLLQATVLLDGNLIRKFTLMTFDKNDISSLVDQLSDKTDESILRLPAGKQEMKEQQFRVGTETVNILMTQSNVGDRESLTVSVSL